VPENWVWVKVKDVFEINPKNEIEDETKVSFIPMTLISDNFANKHTSEIRKWKEVKKGFTHFQEGDVGIAKITPCFENRKSVIFKDLENGFGAGTTELHILRPKSDEVLNSYLLYFAETEMFIMNGVQQFSGAVGQQRVGKNVIEETFFPLPPLAEQRRIVSVIESAFALIDEIEDSKTSLQQIIKQAQAKTLDLAIKGKLVNASRHCGLDPQSPASTTADNSPYRDLKEGWKRCRLKEVGIVFSGKTPKSDELVEQGKYPYFKVSDMNVAGNEKYMNIVTNWLPETYNGIIFPDNSIIFPKNGGAVLTNKKRILTQKSLVDLNTGGFTPSKELYFPFAYYFFLTIDFSTLHKGGVLPTVDKNVIENINILLPPLPEQKLIVERIENIFSILDSMLENL
jgi:type I restriction enzyme S subunit